MLTETDYENLLGHPFNSNQFESAEDEFWYWQIVKIHGEEFYHWVAEGRDMHAQGMDTLLPERFAKPWGEFASEAEIDELVEIYWKAMRAPD